MRSVRGLVALVAVAAILVAFVTAITAAAPPAPIQAAQTETVGNFSSVSVSAGSTSDQVTIDTVNCSVIGGLLDTSGTGTFALNLLWKNAAGTTIATESDVTGAVGDGVGFRNFVRAPTVTVQFEETADAGNAAVVDTGVITCQRGASSVS